MVGGIRGCCLHLCCCVPQLQKVCRRQCAGPTQHLAVGGAAGGQQTSWPHGLILLVMVLLCCRTQSHMLCVLECCEEGRLRGWRTLLL